MKLLPSLRQKKRYIAFEIKSPAQFSFSEVKEDIEQGLLLFFGQLGLARAAPLLLEEKYKNNKCILKINHKYVDECRAALILIKKIKNKPVIIQSITVSGILKKASARM